MIKNSEKSSEMNLYFVKASSAPPLCEFFTALPKLDSPDIGKI